MEWLFFATKAVVLALSLFFLVSLRVRVQVKALDAIQFLLFWAFARDLLFAVFPQPAILFIGDIGIYAALLVWIRRYTGQRRSDYYWFVAAVVAAGVGIAVEAQPDATVFTVHLTANVVLLGYLLYSTSEISVHNTRDSELIVDSRFVLSSSLIILAAIGTVTAYSGGAIGHSAVLLHYIAIWFVLLTQSQLHHLINELTIASLRRQTENLFEFMEALGGGIADRVDIQRILEMICKSASRTIEADGAIILMVDDVRNTLRVRSMSGFYPPPYAVPEVVKHRSASLHEYVYNTEIPVGETLLGQAVEHGEAIFIPDSTNDARLSENTGRDFLFIQSFIAVPLVVNNRVLGVLSLVRRDPDHQFTDEDFQHVQTFASHASMTIDNFYTYLEAIQHREIQREVNIAADIQGKLLPKEFPHRSGTEIAVYSKSARGVSGDYYDVLELDEDKIGLVICDVAGKGVPAALVMVMIHSILRLIASAEREVGDTLTWINRGLSGQIDLDHYATMSYLTISDRARRLSYSNAAHHPLMIVRNDSGVIEQLDTEGLPVGIERDVVYPQRAVDLRRGDVLVLYTDGIVEAMNSEGEQFSTERLTRIIRENSNEGAQQITDTIQSRLDEFVGSARQHDDQTLMVVKIA